MSTSTLFMIVVFLLMLVPLTTIIQDGVMARREAMAGEQLRIVLTATDKYIQAHSIALSGCFTGDDVAPSSTANVCEITLQKLKDEGFLMAGISETNSFSQSYEFYIRRPFMTLNAGDASADRRNRVEGVVIALNSSPMPERHIYKYAPAAAISAGTAGGYVPSGGTTIRGAGNSWEFSLVDAFAITGDADWAGSLCGITGLLNFNGDELSYLSRVPVPGHPERNRMDADIDMNTHSIENVQSMGMNQIDLTDLDCTNDGTIYNTASGLFICRNNTPMQIGDSGNSAVIKQMGVYGSRDLIDKPECPPAANGVYTPQIFISPFVTGTYPDNAPAMHNIQAWAENTSDTQWTVKMRVLISEEGTEAQACVGNGTCLAAEANTLGGTWIEPCGGVAKGTLCSPASGGVPMIGLMNVTTFCRHTPPPANAGGGG